jgi:hypothetical protein
MNKDYSLLSIFMFFFFCNYATVGRRGRYSHQYLNTLDRGCSPLPDITILEIYLFLSIIVQLDDDQRKRLKNYWSTLEQFFI